MILAFILTLLENQLFLCPVGFTPSFMFLYIVNLLLTGFIYVIAMYITGKEYGEGFIGKLPFFSFGTAILALVIIIFGSLFNSAMFNSKDYKNCIEVVEHTEEELAESIPSLEDINRISLMDTNSARKLGDRTLGGLTELVSQYNVGNYYTICINGNVKKVAPLEYNGFWKWKNNDNIPGYVIVDPLTNEAEYVELEKGMRYSPSAYFGEDMMRHFRNDNLGEYFGDYSFQLDDEGNPYWVITTMDAKNGWLNKVPDGVGVMNACNGAIDWYSLDKIPSWVDLVYSGDQITELYNRHGKYINGFLNFSETGVTQVTDDFGYITMGDDVYVYTGITSVSNDESNLGFILVNTRTGVFDYYPIAGAEEYSAMGAAEGIVQNYGYTASFPSLILIENQPTYVMVLKDSNGLVKQYAMVNYKNYTIAVVGDTLNSCVDKYIKAMAGEIQIEVPEGAITISKIEFVIENSQTYCYVVGDDGKIYKAIFSPNQLLLEVGGTISKDEFKNIEDKEENVDIPIENETIEDETLDNKNIT